MKDLMEKCKKVLGNNGYMLRLVGQSSKAYILILIFYILCIYVKDMILILFPKFVFDRMQSGEKLSDIVAPVMMYVLVYVLVHITIALLTYGKGALERKVKVDLNVKLANKYMRIDYSYLEKHESITMFNKARMAISGGLDDIQTLGIIGEQGIAGYFNQFIEIVKNIMLLASLTYIFVYLEDWIIFVVLLCVIINVAFGMRNIYAKVNIRKEAGPYLNKSRYCNKLFRRFEYGKEIRLFDMTDFLVEKFDESTEEYLNVRTKFRNKSCFSEVIMSTVGGVIRVVVLLYLVVQLRQGMISVGDFSMVFAAVLSFSEGIFALFSAVVSMNALSDFMQDYQACLDMKDVEDKQGGRELSLGKHTIEFRDVWFKYPAAKDYALKGVNARLSSDQKIAVVGFNGAGKSTFIKLLLGLYQPDNGQILIDGIDIGEYSVESLKRHISAVYQDFKMYAMTVEENVALHESANGDLLKESMSRSGIGEKISTLALKEKSVIGGFFQKGDLNLSGGESQKIAMARSFYREPEILLLDEPTSALDVFAEDKMYQSVLQNAKGEMMIFISHRLASTKVCDEILVFESGRVIERGSHEELLALGGVYHQMWNVQAEKFKKGGEGCEEN